ncbi:MAG: response regulator [Coleofasciculaceae cyanobacterium]
MNNTQISQQKENILVIDDTPENLRLLVNILTEREYKVRAMPSGKLALSGIHLSPPDLILLDITMPEMDGYQVCKQLKANEQTRDIPVIFVSAINEVLDKVKAFNVGGVDYITKPFQVEEVLARVETHLENRSLQRRLQEKNDHLAEALEELKATQNQLVLSEKMAALGQLIAGIAHEINTPLGAIKASSSNISSALDESLEQLPELFQVLNEEQQTIFFDLLDRALQNNGQLTAREKRQFKRNLIAQLQENQIEKAASIADTLVDLGIYDHINIFFPLFKLANIDFVLQLVYDIARLRSNNQNIIAAVERASKVVLALKSYARYDPTEQKVLAGIANGLETILSLYQNQLKRGVEVIRDYQQLPPILCYPDQLNQVWANLIQNAIQAMQGKGILKIKVYSDTLETSETNSKFAVVSITDSGMGIPPEIQSRIFEPFFTTKSSGEGSGLGLDISNKIIEKHQGKIELESQPGRTSFKVWLPLETTDIKT